MMNSNNKNVFVYYHGDKERGNEIVKALEKLGGYNMFHTDCTSDALIYFIDSMGNIVNVSPEEEEWVKKNYTEAQLPKVEPPKYKPFDKILYIDSAIGKWIPAEYREITDNHGHVFEQVKKILPYNHETEHLSYHIEDSTKL